MKNEEMHQEETRQNQETELKERGSGRPEGSKNKKPKPKVEVDVPLNIDIDEILKLNPEYSVTPKKLVNGRWVYSTKQFSSEKLDRNILLWMLSRISFFESTIKRIGPEDLESALVSESVARDCVSKSDSGLNADSSIDTESDSGSDDTSEVTDGRYAPISRKFWLDRIRSTYTAHRAFLEHTGVIEVDHSYRYRGNDYRNEVDWNDDSDGDGFWEENMDADFDSYDYSADEFGAEYSVTQNQSLDQESSHNGHNGRRAGGRTRKGEDSKSKGYRIAKNYCSAPVKHEIEIKIPNKIKPHLPFHLTDEFFKDVIFDYENAHDYILSLRYEGMSRRDYRSLFHMTHSVRKLLKKDFVTRRDLTSFRANNVVTQANKKIRRYLTYKGRKLFAVDLSNSQPLFLSILLKNFLYNNSYNSKEGFEGAVICGHISVTKYSNAEFPSKTKVLKTLQRLKMLETTMNDLGESGEGGTDPQIGVTKYFDSEDCVTKYSDAESSVTKYSDVDMFFNLCIEGKVYEHLMDIHNAKRRSKKLTRDQMKERFIIFLFAPNESHNETIRSILKSDFPNVLRVIERIKSQRHNTLAILLQCMESHVFLDVVARQLHETENIPFCTLHDSIITTEEHIATVRRVIVDAFESEFAVMPHLKENCWQGESQETLSEPREAIPADKAIDGTDVLRSSPREAPETMGDALVSESEQESCSLSASTVGTVTKPISVEADVAEILPIQALPLEEIDIDLDDVPDTREGRDRMISDLETELMRLRSNGDLANVAVYKRMIDLLQKKFLAKKLDAERFERMNMKATEAKRPPIMTITQMQNALAQIPRDLGSFILANG